MIEAAVFAPSGTERHSADTRSALADAKAAPGTTWVRVTGDDPTELSLVTDVFDVHALSVEDVRSGVRPKTEDYPNHVFVLAKTASLRRGETTFEDEVRTEPVGLFVGPDWLVTMTTDEVDAVSRVWEGTLGEDARILRAGPDFAAYRVLDRLVDDYFLLLDDVETTIETIEEGVLDGPDPEVLEALNAVRRDLLSFRKVLWPTREAVGTLARGDVDEVRTATEKYYRDVYDHLVELVDLTETYRDLARGARDIYQNTVAQSTNEVMKTLTVVATVLLPLTFVVGVYGMNFSSMPELEWAYGYHAVMLGMALVSLVLVAYFRRHGWL
ncbi:magnesium/cobalt transporter CorA [Halobium salinum]|uniref:Magnesium transport protein CorA n=1 Tax=Halobium salinum TaxID=1364940 RepID=A0ABD5PDH3_9EURY|nr:magnesium/cobalt transporter CorA [Halobium salinum]